VYGGDETDIWIFVDSTTGLVVFHAEGAEKASDTSEHRCLRYLRLFSESGTCVTLLLEPSPRSFKIYRR
jgi:hypothetical protein